MIEETPINPDCPHCDLELIFNGYDDSFGCESCGARFHNDEDMSEFEYFEYGDEE